MTRHTTDVLCIGNAIVDVLARADETFLLEQGMHKGGMALIDEAKAASIYGKMGPALEISGGSAANTAVGVASFGGNAAFLGRVKNDPLGRTFIHDIERAGVRFCGHIANNGPATACCYIVVTPDGERTMNTFLGAAQLLAPEHLTIANIAAAAISYLEGYLWDPPQAKRAFLTAANIAHANNRSVALTLSDVFCVDRWRDEFLSLLQNGAIDILFANEAELHSLFQTADFATALSCAKDSAPLTVVTRSENGAVIVSSDETYRVDAFPVERLVDSTGAGDLFAAGFLYGYARGFSHPDSALLGALAASEIISHFGARPERDLAVLAMETGLLDRRSHVR